MTDLQSAGRPAKLPAVYHPTISEYYRLSLRLEDYIRCLVAKQDWPAVFDSRPVLPGETDTNQSYKELLSGVLVSFSEAQVTPVEDSWKNATGNPVGLQLQTQTDLVSHALMKLFRRGTQKRPTARLSEIDVLLKGYVRVGEGRAPYAGLSRDRPGLSRQNVNDCERILQSSPSWIELHGRIGTDLMLHLLTETTIFIPQLNNCFLQLLGPPMDCLTTLAKISAERRLRETADRKRKLNEEKRQSRKKKRKTGNGVLPGEEAEEEPRLAVPGQVVANQQSGKNLSRHTSTSSILGGTMTYVKRTPVDITVPRMKMFYARHHHRNRLNLAFRGLPDSHILNTVKPTPPRRALPPPSDPFFASLSSRFDIHEEARIILRYIFPREHNLENVWNWRKQEDRYTKTVMPEYRDWSNREEELLTASVEKRASTPKRLKRRGILAAEDLIQRHRKCDYRRLLDMHCPRKTRKDGLARGTSNHEWTTPPHEVIRYARAVAKKLMPLSFWGSVRNVRIINNGINKIILGKRYEAFSMHHLLQGFAADDFVWLHASPEQKQGRTNQSDHLKRRQLVEELIFWFYDGFLMPLIRNAFYVTETGTTRNQTVYFRLDDWAEVCKPVLRSLRKHTLIKLSQGRQRALIQAPQAYTVHRLVPKVKGLRPIANLGKRVKLVAPDGTPKWLPSINQVLEHPYEALNIAKHVRPDLMQSALLGLKDIHPKLKAFKYRLLKEHGKIPELHFVKVDVKSAFDSIRLDKLFEVMDEILNSEDQFVVRKFVRILPSTGRKPRKYGSLAHSRHDMEPFHSRLLYSTQRFRNAVLLDQVQMTSHFGEQLRQTLHSHLREHLVKIGPEFYKQKTGIPQGSKVSSLLCTLYYGHMERVHFSFVRDSNCLLLRMIDDFLLVTTSRDKAETFLQTMHAGFPDYGCQVAPDKSLVSFRPANSETKTNICQDNYFTYCGFAIRVDNLDISIDITRKIDMHSKNAFSVKHARHIGEGFGQWLCRVLENYNSVLLNDTSLFSTDTVIGNIYANFSMAAMRSVSYLADVDYLAQGNADSVIAAIYDAITRTCRSNRMHMKYGDSNIRGAACAVSDLTFAWLGAHAFHRVLALKGIYFAVLVHILESHLQSPTYRWIERQTHLLKAVETVWSRLKLIPF